MAPRGQHGPADGQRIRRHHLDQRGKIFNLYPRKGAIEVGSDADLVVWDPAASRTISVATQHSALDVNMFEGMKVTGLPVVTLSQGKVMWQNGQLKVTRGAGRNVPRPCHQDAFGAVEKTTAAARPSPVKRKVSVHQTP